MINESCCFFGFRLSAAQDPSQAPRPTRKNDAAAVVHRHRHLRRDQEAAHRIHVAVQDLVPRVPAPDLGQSQTRAPDQDLLNNHTKTAPGRGGLVFVL